ncbi:PAS domain S-box protein [Methanoregula sp.]|uniref:PAS domain S-box protein n=1 Tax=Methanoregula sp. TaxID=2052170 RepID=UPI003564ABCC
MVDDPELFKAFSDRASDAIFLLDADGTIHYVNDAGSRKTGYSRGELLAMKISALVPEINPETWQDIINTIRKNGSMIHESHQRVRNGKILDIEIALTGVTRDAREYVFAVVRDITGRKRAERDLLKNCESRFRDLADLLPQIVFELDENLMFTFYNWNTIEITGYAYDDLAQKRTGISDIIREADRMEVARFFARLQRDITSDHTVCCIVTHDGREIPAVIYASPIIGEKRVAGIHGVIVDITEQVRLEKALEVTNQKLNMMNSITRHDVLNNITGLLGLCDMLSATTADRSAQELISEIHTQVIKIKDQIIFTREYQDVGVKAPQWHGLFQSIGSAASAIGRDMTEVQLTLPGTETEIYADSLLCRVFYNLIDNSFRHGGSVRNITIETEFVPDGDLVIRYRDDGIGISAEEKQRIFEQGYGKNTGFGLYIIREILGITGLSIRETGIAGCGVLFEITVPKTAWRPCAGNHVSGT